MLRIALFSLAICTVSIRTVTSNELASTDMFPFERFLMHVPEDASPEEPMSEVESEPPPIDSENKAHVIIFSILFGLVMIASSIVLYLVYRVKKKVVINLTTTVLLFCFLIGMSRVLLLGVNAYDSGYPTNYFPRTLVFIIWGSGFPLLTGAFALVVLNLYDLAWHTKRMRKLSGFLIRLRVFFLTNVCLEFTVQLVTDILMSLNLATHQNFLVCQIYFVVWGSLIVLCANVFTFQIFDATAGIGRSSREINEENVESYANEHNDSYSVTLQVKTYRLIRLITISCILLVVGSIWGMFAFYDIMTNVNYFVKYQTYMRSVEFIMVCTLLQMNSHHLSLVAMRPKLARRRSTTSSRASQSSIRLNPSIAGGFINLNLFKKNSGKSQQHMPGADSCADNETSQGDDLSQV